MQTQRLRDAVDQHRIWDGNGDDVRNIDLDEVDSIVDVSHADIADVDENQEDHGDEQTEGGEERPDEAGSRRALKLGFAEIGASGMSVCEGVGGGGCSSCCFS